MNDNDLKYKLCNDLLKATLKTMEAMGYILRWNTSEDDWEDIHCIDRVKAVKNPLHKDEPL